MGELIPVYVQDVIPNDTFKLSVSNLIRFAPLYAPMMSEVDVYFHFFFVPNRLIWSKWEEFITGSRNGFKVPEDQLPEKPYYTLNSEVQESAFHYTEQADNNYSRFAQYLRSGSLADYLGFQTYNNNSADDLGLPTTSYYDLDAMPFRAYNLIWSSYYRDENLADDPWFAPDGSSWYADQSGVINATASGRNEPYDFMQLRRRAWKKDYFTSALPWAQKGDDVVIPGTGGSSSGGSLSGTGTVYATGIPYFNYSPNESVNAVARSALNTYQTSGSYLATESGQALTSRGNASAGLGLSVNVAEIASKLSLGAGAAATEGTIRELRRAMAAQKFLELRAVGGSRYQEQNLMFFGIKGSDARLQRPEFLGGCKNHVVISQLLQTSETTQSSALGTPAGNAVSAGGKFIFNRTFEEYGFIMGIMSIMPKASYMEGIPKMYLKRDVYDYYWPQFAKIGEQPIENQELYYDFKLGSDPEVSGNTNLGTFGYTPRYAEYRFRNDRVSGDFKDSLKFWTLARDFSSIPNLNESFIECNPSNRVFNVTDQNIHKCWCELSFDVLALRPVESNVNLL